MSTFFMISADITSRNCMSPVYLTDVISIPCLLCKYNPFIEIRKKIIVDSTGPTSGNALDVKKLNLPFFNHVIA